MHKICSMLEPPKYSQIKSGSLFLWNSRWYGKLVSTFGTFCIVAVNRRGASRTSENSTIAYVKGEPTFWTTDHTFRTATHVSIHLPSKTKREILKILLEEPYHTKILTVVKRLIIRKFTKLCKQLRTL